MQTGGFEAQILALKNLKGRKEFYKGIQKEKLFIFKIERALKKSKCLMNYKGLKRLWQKGFEEED